VATLIAEELHVAVALRFCVEPSLYVPVAVNCCVLPALIEGFAGLMLIDARTGEVTVKLAVPLIDPEVAVIVVLPTVKPLDNPTELIVATMGNDEIHVTDELRSCVLLSLYIPVAWNCTDNPAATVPFAGLTAIDTSAGEPTVSVVEPQTDPVQALRVAVPCATP
jgi:hypothetical protein